MELNEPPLAHIRWTPCWRIIPSRFPPIDLFERVADPADLEAVIEIESMTNPRLREEIGELHLVAEADRVSGPGSSYIMAAFTHLNPEGSRFSDGSWGVYYAARDLDTAIAETIHHREYFMQATGEPPMELDMRVILADLEGELHDIRSPGNAPPELLDPEDYAPAQTLGRVLREAGSWGVIYCSVRRKGGENAVIFRPPVLSNCRQERHLCYVWDGQRISHVYEKRALSD